MIQSFLHKRLPALRNNNDAKGVRGDLVERVRRRLTALDAAQTLRELDVPGWRLHPLYASPGAIQSPSMARGGSHSNGRTETLSE